MKGYLENKVRNPNIVYQDVNESYDPKRLGKSFILDSRDGKFYSQNAVEIPEKADFLFKPF